MSVFWVLLLTVALMAITAIYTKFHWSVKAMLILYLVPTALFAFTLLENYQGKPAEIDNLPNTIVVYGQNIDQLKGEIHIMAAFPGKKSPPPYYVTVPYVEKLHKALSQGKRQFEGEPFILKSSEPLGGDGRLISKKGMDGRQGRSMSLESKTFHIYKIPPRKLPLKIK